MSELQEIYGDKTQKDIYVRHNMKKKIVKAFGNKLTFITVRPNSSDVVISSEAVEATLEMSDKKSCIQRVASFYVRIFRNIVSHYHLLAGPQQLKNFVLKTDFHLLQ